MAKIETGMKYTLANNEMEIRYPRERMKYALAKNEISNGKK